MTTNRSRSDLRVLFPIADIQARWLDCVMTWLKTLKWAMPIWIVGIGTVGALMFLTEFAAEVGKAKALRCLIFVGFAALPLIAFLVKATADDVARFRACFLKKNARGDR